MPHTLLQNITYINPPYSNPVEDPQETFITIAKKLRIPFTTLSIVNEMADYQYFFNGSSYISQNKLNIFARLAKQENSEQPDVISTIGSYVIDLTRVSEDPNIPLTYSVKDTKDIHQVIHIYIPSQARTYTHDDPTVFAEDPRIMDIQLPDNKKITLMSAVIVDRSDPIKYKINVGIGMIKDDTKEVVLTPILGPIANNPHYTKNIKNPAPLGIIHEDGKYYLKILARPLDEHDTESRKLFLIFKKEVNIEALLSDDITSLYNSETQLVELWEEDRIATEMWNIQFRTSFPYSMDLIERLGPGSQPEFLRSFDEDHDIYIMFFHWVEIKEHSHLYSGSIIPADVDIVENYQSGLLLLKKDTHTGVFSIIGVNARFAKPDDFRDIAITTTPFSNTILMINGVTHGHKQYYKPDVISAESKVILNIYGISSFINSITHEPMYAITLGLNDAQTIVITLTIEDFIHVLSSIPVYAG